MNIHAQYKYIKIYTNNELTTVQPLIVSFVCVFRKQTANNQDLHSKNILLSYCSVE